MLSDRLLFHPQSDEDVFAAVPATSAVFALRGREASSEPYISKTANIRRRLQRLLAPPEAHSKRLNLRNLVASIEYSPTGSDFESGFLLYRVLRAEFPKTYEKRLRLRPAPLVKMHLENEYPRASVTTRLGRMAGKNIYYGPFASRVAAEKFMNDALDFFKMRRCVEDLNPDPKFPGCVYSEMKMCLAPCFRGCTDDEYRAEVVRVEDFLDTRGESLKRALAAERDDASAKMEFENAAAIHSRIDKLAPVLREMPEFVHRIDRLNGVIVQKSSQVGECGVVSRRRRRACRSFRVSHLRYGTHQVAIDGSAHSDRVVVISSVRSKQRSGAHGASRDPETLVLSRDTRAGEIFFGDAKGELPMRRLVRGIGRVYKGEAPEGATNPAPELFN